MPRSAALVSEDRQTGCEDPPMTDAAVAVVVRTKDRPDFLRRALDSITGQTLTDWECVIVNDGGKPEPVDAAIARLPSEHAARITVIHSPSSRGRWVSANVGVLRDDPRPCSRCTTTMTRGTRSSSPGPCEYLNDHPDRNGVVSRIEIRWERRAGDGLRGREHRDLPARPARADAVGHPAVQPLRADRVRLSTQPSRGARPVRREPSGRRRLGIQPARARTRAGRLPRPGAVRVLASAGRTPRAPTGTA